MSIPQFSVSTQFVVCYIFLIQYTPSIPGRSMHLLVASWCCLGVILPVQLASSWIRDCFFLSGRCKCISYLKIWLPCCWLYSTCTQYVLVWLSIGRTVSATQKSGCLGCTQLQPNMYSKWWYGFRLVETISIMYWCSLIDRERGEREEREREREPV
jgi:hypothetical protein